VVISSAFKAMVALLAVGGARCAPGEAFEDRNGARCAPYESVMTKRSERSG
jgi:hypothetical protein